MEQSWDDVQHEVFRKTEAARARLRTLMDQIPESEQAAVAAARQSLMTHAAHLLAEGPWGDSTPEGTYIAELMDCPVCNHPGALVSGPLRIEQELVESRRYDEPDGLEITDLWFEPDRLQCAVCEIRLLTADEVRHVGVPNRVEITANIRRFLPPWNNSGTPDDLIDQGPWTSD